ncbi:RHS repeat domain-containing protein [Marivirga tractuosa]|uniref:RHS repeat domain-containing protein n=1 Tax=Marivirga tractuosa TaxID=1006 RepID=UPI001C86766F|nr:RHS repeat-associated core domain-containing protein [Marivirga tractuosa]
MIKATDYIGSLILENDTLQFIQTAEGRVVPKTMDGVDKNEYQYHLKDHLGNVRTTFAVRDDNYATDFETAGNPYFDNYDEITILSNPLKKSGNYAHRLSGGGTDIVGLMKTLYVSKGDKVSAEVYGKYLDAQFTNDEINGAALVNALVTMLGGGTLTGEGTIIENNLNSDFISAAMADGSEEESPKAYLNYIMLDENFNYVNSGFERLSESAADPGVGSGTHQKLTFEEIQIEEDGYLMVFLSNESQQSVEVFWDDFRVDHHYNAVLQADDYYPFGLTFNSYQRSYSKANNHKYNQGTGDKTFQGAEGKFFRTERVPELGWDLTKFRAYDPALGRFMNIDPMADKFSQESLTPYQYSFNNPIRFNDPYGDCPICPETAVEGFKAFGQMMSREFNKGLDAVVSFVGPDSNFEGAGEEVAGGIPLVTAVDMPSESTKTTAEKTEATLNIDLLLVSSGGGAGKHSGSSDPSVDIAESLSKVKELFAEGSSGNSASSNENVQNGNKSSASGSGNEIELDTLRKNSFFQLNGRAGYDFQIRRDFGNGNIDTVETEFIFKSVIGI